MTRLAFALALLPAAALAEGSVAVQTSQIRTEPSKAPGAWLDVVFENRATNGPRSNGQYDLGHGIAFTYTYTPGDDTVEVMPPAGYVCAPACSMTVAEGSTGRVTLYSLEGVGM